VNLPPLPTYVLIHVHAEYVLPIALLFKVQLAACSIVSQCSVEPKICSPDADVLVGPTVSAIVQC